MDSPVKDSFVAFRTSQGQELRGNLLRFTRYLAVFEIYDPSLVLRMSEVLGDFKFIIQDHVVYSEQE